jgi:hypothetical protein
MIAFTPGPHEQHFWNGVEQVPLTTSLQLSENTAKFESQEEVGHFLTQQNIQQEVAILENERKEEGPGLRPGPSQ